MVELWQLCSSGKLHFAPCWNFAGGSRVYLSRKSCRSIIVVSAMAHASATKRSHSSVENYEEQRKISRQKTTTFAMNDLVVSPQIAKQLAADLGRIDGLQTYFAWEQNGDKWDMHARKYTEHTQHASIHAWTSGELAQLIKIFQFSWVHGLTPSVDTYYSDKSDEFICKITANHPLPNPVDHGTPENPVDITTPPDQRTEPKEGVSMLHFKDKTNEANARAKLLSYLLQHKLLSREDLKSCLSVRAAESPRA